MFDRSLFDAARDRVSIEDLAGKETQLRRAGHELRGQCPLCGAGQSKSASAPFAINPEKRTWQCYGCGLFGDVVDLERALRGGTPVEAARRLVGDAPLPERTNRPAPKPEPKGPSVSDLVAAEILREAKPFAGSLAERYLLNRGVLPAVVEVAAPNLRFHPFAKWGWDDAARQWTRAPALVVPVVTPGPDGEPVPTGGVHCTYVARDGRGKAALDPAKRMWGPQMRDGKPGGAWLIGPAGGCSRVVGGEGIETGLSIASLRLRREGAIPRCFAALSLDRLQGRLLRDNEGCIDPYDPKPNPEAPAFTWPGVADVLIGVDRDMGAIKIKARTPRGRVCDFVLDGEARARLCARFAAAAWKAAGTNAVRVAMPSPGSDFNDDLRRVLARSGVRK